MTLAIPSQIRVAPFLMPFHKPSNRYLGMFSAFLRPSHQDLIPSTKGLKNSPIFLKAFDSLTTPNRLLNFSLTASIRGIAALTILVSFSQFQKLDMREEKFLKKSNIFSHIFSKSRTSLRKESNATRTSPRDAVKSRIGMSRASNKPLMILKAILNGPLRIVYTR